MSEKNTGGPAFPVTGTVYSQDREAFEVGPVRSGSDTGDSSRSNWLLLVHAWLERWCRMTTDRDLPPITLDWLYLLLWVLACVVFYAASTAVTSYVLWTNSDQILSWLLSMRDFIESMTWTSPFLFY